MTTNKKIILQLQELLKREQRLGQVFENIKNNKSYFEKETNESVLDSLIAYSSTIHKNTPSNSLNDFDIMSLDYLEIYLNSDISLASIILKLSDTFRKDLFHLNSSKMLSLMKSIV